MVKRFEIETKRSEEREILKFRLGCPEQAAGQGERLLSRAESSALLYEKRSYALKALDLADRLGDSEITELNLALVRQVLVFMYQQCEFRGHDSGDYLQQNLTKLEPGYKMATDMFEALYTAICQFQLAQEKNYGFAKTSALLALRAAIRRDLKMQIAGSDDKQGIARSLLLVADVYQLINDPKRAADLRDTANNLV